MPAGAEWQQFRLQKQLLQGLGLGLAVCLEHTTRVIIDFCDTPFVATYRGFETLFRAEHQQSSELNKSSHQDGL